MRQVQCLHYRFPDRTEIRYSGEIPFVGQQVHAYGTSWVIKGIVQEDGNITCYLAALSPISSKS